MARKPLIRQNLNPYHIFNRVNSKRDYPEALMDEIWRLYCDVICIITWVFGVRVHVFVLMSNHYHMIATTPDSNLDAAMLYFHREISRGLRALTANQDYRFQSRYRSKIIDNEIQFGNTFSYIARNPAEAKMVIDPLRYRYSTLSAQYGAFRLRCPISECRVFEGTLPEELSSREKWLQGWGRV